MKRKFVLEEKSFSTSFKQKLSYLERPTFLLFERFLFEKFVLLKTRRIIEQGK